MAYSGGTPEVERIPSCDYGGRAMKLGPSLAALVTLLAPRIAFATWSIVAVDAETGEVGVGAATCTVGVELVQGIVPGVGVLAAQAYTNLLARNAATRALRSGASLHLGVQNLDKKNFDIILSLQGFTVGYRKIE